jgi:hypothetical protein
MKTAQFIAILLSLSFSLNGQTYQISNYKETEAVFKYLLLPNNEISKNDTITEQIVDLVIPVLSDSIIDRKKQHHKLGPLGWFIHAFGGFNWRAMSLKKEKFVGTVVRQSRSGEEQFTEYDINYDLNFHLKKYLYRVFDAYDRQGKISRYDVTSKKQHYYKSSPFVRDTNQINIRDYRLHCELTPEREFRAPLNYLFFPTLPGGGGLQGHPNFENDNPSIGLYGTFCLDCNHSCHPEIHPYEWIWWLKTNESNISTEKEWFIGLLHEGSNRLKKWSTNPMTGNICIPFAFNEASAFVIDIEHLVMNQFLEEGLKTSAETASKFGPSQKQQIVTVEGRDFSKTIAINFINPIKTEGLKYWISQLNYDPQTKVISGYLNYAVSVMDLYTCRIRFR